jgi:diguanylate cyclase (GGDEF)-like protein
VEKNSMVKNRKIQFYISIFLIFAILNFIVNFKIYYENREHYFKEHFNTILFQYNTIIKGLKEKGNIYFDEVVNNETILHKLYQLNQDINSSKLREELTTLLEPSFQRMRESSVKQLHFHTADSRSLLRMHRKDKFGDSLKGFRYSVELTNKRLQSSHGFEEGRIYNGFRNVYPLFYRGEHIGSVEISFSFQAVRDTLHDIFGGNYSFIISKDTVDKKVLDRSEYYIQSNLNSEFLFEKSLVKSKMFRSEELFDISNKLNEKLFEDVKENLQNRENFSKRVSLNGDYYLVNFLTIENLKEKVVAYLISYDRENFIEGEFYKFLSYVLIGDLIAILLIFLIINHTRKEELSFINSLLDNQNNLIFVKRRDEIIKANNRLLNFFGFSSLKELKNSNETICDFFLKEEGYLYKSDFDDKNFLIDKLLQNQESQFKVRMVDYTTKVVRTFSINIAFLKEQYLYMIILSDITPNEFEKRFIEDKAFRDKLTGAYNRDKFDKDLKERILKQGMFSLILIDLDKFSEINSDKGHMTGDKILMEFYHLIDFKIKKSDIVYRWGGEEFIIIVDDKMLDATKLAEKLRVIIETHRFYKEIKVNASFGVTEYRKFESVDDIMSRAEKALFTAKLSGRNCVITC